MAHGTCLLAAAMCVVAASCERATPTKVKQPVTPRDAAPPAEPIDIVLAIDLSRSMEETDLPPNRLDATKAAVRRFLSGYKLGRVGLVIFAQQPKVAAALTTDLQALDQTVAKFHIGPDLGTATGDGLALAVDQLASSLHKAVILIADGESNWVIRYDDDQASAVAKAQNTKVYTVRVGGEGTQDSGGMAADQSTLRKIAVATDGEFYRASDPASFDRGLQAIRDKLDATRHRSEKPLGP